MRRTVAAPNRTTVVGWGAGAGSATRVRRSWPWVAVLAAACLALSACGLHINKHGVSGNVLGHSFSAASGALPTGFPSAIPVPAGARVLGGGGTDGGWDVAFAATGSVTSAATDYADQFRSAGYAVSDEETGSTVVTTPPGSAGGATSSTVGLEGSTFTAKNAQWTVQVEAGSSTSSVKAGPLKPGEFAINLTAVHTTAGQAP